MAQQRIHWPTGGAKARVHLYQDGRHLGLESHLRHLMTMSALKQTGCHLDMCIYILCFPALGFSILIHMPRIASAIKISFQISWLTKVHPQVSTLSAAWQCSWQPFWRRQQPFEWTWQRRRELTEDNRIFEYYHFLQLADTLKYILKGIFICIIKEQCSHKGECTWTAQNGCHKTIIDILCQREWFHIADTPMAKWASTECQQCLALHHGHSAWQLVGDIQQWRTGCLYR